MSFEVSQNPLSVVHFQHFKQGKLSNCEGKLASTGFSSEIGTKLRDWALGQAGGSCYSQAALSSKDSKNRYIIQET